MEKLKSSLLNTNLALKIYFGYTLFLIFLVCSAVLMFALSDGQSAINHHYKGADQAYELWQMFIGLAVLVLIAVIIQTIAWWVVYKVHIKEVLKHIAKIFAVSVLLMFSYALGATSGIILFWAIYGSYLPGTGTLLYYIIVPWTIFFVFVYFFVKFILAKIKKRETHQYGVKALASLGALGFSIIAFPLLKIIYYTIVGILIYFLNTIFS